MAFNEAEINAILSNFERFLQSSSHESNVQIYNLLLSDIQSFSEPDKKTFARYVFANRHCNPVLLVLWLDLQILLSG
jgi:hypothetical protein